VGGAYDVGNSFAGADYKEGEPAVRSYDYDSDAAGGSFAGTKGGGGKKKRKGKGKGRGHGAGAPLDPVVVDFKRTMERGEPYQRWAVPGVLPEGYSYRWRNKIPFERKDRPMLRMGNNSKIMHAEVHCLAQLKDIGSARGGEMLICELDPLGVGYDTAIPCRMCTRALNQVGIGRVVYTSHSGLVEMTTRENPGILCETLAMARG